MGRGLIIKKEIVVAITLVVAFTLLFRLSI